MHLSVIKRACGLGAYVLLAATLWIAPLAADSPPESQEVLTQAHSLRDAGNFVAAAELLRAQMARRPDDGEIARLLAQTLYWLKDIAGAHALYDSALLQHPEDTTLRLQYSRMLAETGERTRARDLLLPLLGISATRAEAQTLLGTLSYWDGDLNDARRRFEEALQANPNQEEAKRQLREIQTSSAPWIRVSSGGWHDNQPLDRLALGLEAGWFWTPLTKLTAHMQSTRYWIDDSTRTIAVAEAAIAHYVPPAHLETELAAGAVRRSQGGNLWDWTGRAALGLRLPRHFALRARAERTPYFSTKSSLDTPVMVQTATGVLHFGDVRGWLGEAAYLRQSYPDDNVVQTAYGWLLAPLVHQKGVEVQVGYSFAASNAGAFRFVLAQPDQPYPPSDSRFSTAGSYAPYYTPSHLLTHSALAGFTLGFARGASFRFDGSYGVRATDDAPFFFVSGGKVLLGTYSRTSSPWNVRTSFKMKLRDDLTLEATAEMGRTIFYTSATAGLRITYHFMPGETRQAGGK